MFGLLVLFDDGWMDGLIDWLVRRVKDDEVNCELVLLLLSYQVQGLGFSKVYG